MLKQQLSVLANHLHGFFQGPKDRIVTFPGLKRLEMVSKLSARAPHGISDAVEIAEGSCKAVLNGVASAHARVLQGAVS